MTSSIWIPEQVTNALSKKEGVNNIAFVDISDSCNISSRCYKRKLTNDEILKIWSKNFTEWYVNGEFICIS